MASRVTHDGLLALRNHWRTLEIARTRIVEKKKVAEKQRSFFDYKCEGNACVCRWNGSGMVTLASNHLTHL
ncbi:hypothetical protein T4D_1757 [Trichinella pseudospiralis]|uniref:Uncharacterized protein n=1 Tax=Trichinella pseudospiralis TaxID=6337 RepID=A0A0V1FLL9_TRIPS|nr:hypothetical protein T4D_1757 [Trichinella pseudospiralis]